MSETQFSIDSDDLESGSAVYANAAQAESRGRQLYSQRGDSSDEVDPRKLVRDPTLSELRWYYRRTFAKKLVDKPIEDAFKNGFEIEGPRAEEAEKLFDSPKYRHGEGYIEAYMMAEKKARRDGFALVYVGTDDDSAGTHVSPISEDVNVERISHVKVLKVDQLSDSAPHEQIKEGTGLKRDQYKVRPTGIVVNTDIQSVDYRNPVGYVLDAEPPQFIHADRVQHLTWNPEVDGDYNDNNDLETSRWDTSKTYLGEWEGDSVLLPSYDLLKGLVKGNWSIMQALFRHASHMYHVTLPEDGTKEDLSNAVSATRNINAKSSLVFPHGYEMEQHDSGNEMDPTQHFEVIFDQVCATHEMTKSVLFGTQSGTVSGSETDIKNYFNKIERYRSQRAKKKLLEYLTMAKRMLDSRTSDDYTYEVPIEWGPMFKVDEETRMQMLQTQAQALTTLIGKYVITPDEAREIITAEWSEIDLDSLNQDQMDVLDRVMNTSMGQGLIGEANDPSPDTPQRGGKEGGRPEGARQQSGNSQSTPNNQ